MLTNLTNFASKAEAQTSVIYDALETCSRRELLGDTWTQSSSCQIAHVPSCQKGMDGPCMDDPRGLTGTRAGSFRQADFSKTYEKMSRLPCCSVLLNGGMGGRKRRNTRSLVLGPYYLQYMGKPLNIF